MHAPNAIRTTMAACAIAAGLAMGCSRHAPERKEAPESHEPVQAAAPEPDAPPGTPPATQTVPSYTFEPATPALRRFALKGPPGETERRAIAAVPGLRWVEAENPSGPRAHEVLWDDPRASQPGSLAALEALGVPVAGEVIEFALQRPPGYSTNCASCLYSSFEAASKAPGVREVRTFLGDPENRSVVLVVDPDATNAARLGEVMRASHAHGR